MKTPTIVLLALLVGNGLLLGFTLTWTPNSEPDLDHYNVYRKDLSCTVQGVFNWVKSVAGVETTTEDVPATTGTFCYGLGAVDTSANESAMSNTVEISNEPPPPPPTEEPPPPPVEPVCLKVNPKGKCVKWGTPQ